MRMVIDPGGKVRCLYGEAVDLSVLGEVSMRRASYVEPDIEGHWWADLSPLAGPRLGPFPLRSQALVAEENWLHRNWLNLSAPLPPAETQP